MADNQTQEVTQQKYFLDLVGLTKLWAKIKSSFADKEFTESNIGSLHDDIDTLEERITLVGSDVDNLENTVLTIAPKEVDYYAEALEAAKLLAVGTTINVKSPNTSAEDETPSGYATGIYIVTGNGEIKLISTSDGDDGELDITSIGERVDSLEDSVVKSAKLVDEKGDELNQSFSVTNNVLLIAHDDTFDINSESVRALTHRAVAAKFRNIENSLTQIPKFKVAVVDELPTDEISLSTIYLLRNTTNTSDKNLFTEYIYVETTKDNPETTDVNESKYSWEKLGEQTLVLEDIVTKNELNNTLSIALADYAKTNDVKSMISEANDNLKIDILKTVGETYATIESVEELAEEIEAVTGDLDKYLTKDDAAVTYLSINDAEDIYFSKTDAEQSGWMTEDDVLTSIQSGNIGNAIRITDEQIETITNNK